VMVGTETLRGMVGRGDFAQLESNINDSRDSGSWLMPLDLAKLVVEGRITEEVAMDFYPDHQLLAQRIRSAREQQSRNGAGRQVYA
jgi:Tfp pilus assembly pilus retraction ATPase PilT